MNPQDQQTIEQLLEQLGSDEPIGDPTHRYVLRRSLLNSRYFEVHRASVVWERVIAISGPAFAGGFVVVMVALAVHVGPGVLESESTNSAPLVQVSLPEDEVLASVDVRSDELAGRSVLPVVEVVDFQEQPPVAHFVNFVHENMVPVMAN
jgi:hypothetical protein